MAAREPSPEEMLPLCRLGLRARAIVEELARSPSLVRDPDAVVAAHVQTQTADVSEVLDHLAAWGWLEYASSRRRQLVVDSPTLAALSNRLRGMLDGRWLAEREAVEVVPVVTLPETSDALRGFLGREADASFETRDGFSHVASRARRRIVFLVPFMDATGAEAVARMLSACDAQKKIVIARPDSRGNRHYAKFTPQLTAVGAEVREYWRSRGGAAGPAMETFHAKLVLADTDLVYVGSSNLMASSLDDGLECGVLLEGQHARPFCRIVEAVLAVSSPLPT